jgi:hypothetical protein
MSTVRLTALRTLTSREIPAYRISEAAHYLRVPKATVRAWALGQRRFRPVLKRPRSPRPPATMHFKPPGAPLPSRLEPAPHFRAAEVRVGILVETFAAAPPVCARAARHAVSSWAREGEPDGKQLVVVMRWSRRRVEDAEWEGRPPDGALGGASPPPPWYAVAG